VKNSVLVAIVAMFISVLTLMGLDARAVSEPRAELSVSFKAMRAYDPATNAFSATSYLVKTHNGLRCSAVLAGSTVAVAEIEALAMEGDARVWSGSRADFATTGLPNPCP